jgi:hypothetical protein
MKTQGRSVFHQSFFAFVLILVGFLMVPAAWSATTVLNSIMDSYVDQNQAQVYSEYAIDRIISFVTKDEYEDWTRGAKIASLASKENAQYPKPVLIFEYEYHPQEGCSHVFWKNHPGLWVGYTPGALLKNVFPNSAGYVYSKTTGNNAILYIVGNKTLMEALEFPGSDGPIGGAMILLRNAVAALLNAADSRVNYSLDPTDVLTYVSNAPAKWK